MSGAYYFLGHHSSVTSLEHIISWDLFDYNSLTAMFVQSRAWQKKGVGCHSSLFDNIYCRWSIVCQVLFRCTVRCERSGSMCIFIRCLYLTQPAIFKSTSAFLGALRHHLTIIPGTRCLVPVPGRCLRIPILDTGIHLVMVQKQTK